MTQLASFSRLSERRKKKTDLVFGSILCLFFLTDVANCIERHPAPSISAPKSNMWPSVALRSSRIQPVKSGVAQKVSIALSELGLSTQLIMPTSKNIAKLDQVQKELGLMVEVKKGLDRLLQEGRTWKKKKDVLLGIAPTPGPGGANASVGGGSVTPAPEGGEMREIKMEDVQLQGNESIGGERQRVSFLSWFFT